MRWPRCLPSWRRPGSPAHGRLRGHLMTAACPRWRVRGGIRHQLQGSGGSSRLLCNCPGANAWRRARQAAGTQAIAARFPEGVPAGVEVVTIR